MKTNLLLLFFLTFSSFVIASCNQTSKYRPDKKITDVFKVKYPKASKIEWEQKNGYFVAEFYENGIESEAWFDSSGKWSMTESNIKYNMLPQAIRDHFEKSIYNTWKKEDIDKIERADSEPIYIIEIEKNEQETDLYYTANGKLVKSVNAPQKGDISPQIPVSSMILNQIRQKYPEAVIIDTELDKGKYEVDILDKGKAKEVVFNGNTWEATYWEVTKAEVPTVVMDAFRKSAYGKHRIDDIHYFETPTATYYHFELEQGDMDTYLSIDSNGNIIK